MWRLKIDVGHIHGGSESSDQIHGSERGRLFEFQILHFLIFEDLRLLISGDRSGAAEQCGVEMKGRLSAQPLKKKNRDDCDMCFEKWDSPNPLRREVSKSETLPRAKGYGCTCEGAEGLG